MHERFPCNLPPEAALPLRSFPHTQEDGAEFAAEGFAAAPALPAVAEPWDEKSFAAAAPGFEGAAPVSGQWSEAATPGWEAAAAPVAPPMDFSAGNVDFAAAYQPR
jgi:hypothetical protein